jgi:hypothetical protein
MVAKKMDTRPGRPGLSGRWAQGNKEVGQAAEGGHMVARKMDTGPGRPGLGAWKMGAGQGSLARGTEGGHLEAKKVNTGY